MPDLPPEHGTPLMLALNEWIDNQIAALNIPADSADGLEVRREVSWIHEVTAQLNLHTIDHPSERKRAEIVFDATRGVIELSARLVARVTDASARLEIATTAARAWEVFFPLNAVNGPTPAHSLAQDAVNAAKANPVPAEALADARRAEEAADRADFGDRDVRHREREEREHADRDPLGLDNGDDFDSEEEEPSDDERDHEGLAGAGDLIAGNEIDRGAGEHGMDEFAGEHGAEARFPEEEEFHRRGRGGGGIE